MQDKSRNSKSIVCLGVPDPARRETPLHPANGSPPRASWGPPLHHPSDGPPPRASSGRIVLHGTSPSLARGGGAGGQARDGGEFALFRPHSSKMREDWVRHPPRGFGGFRCVGQHVACRDASCLDAVAHQPGISPSVVLGLLGVVVDHSVHFDGQPGIEAIEIQNAGAGLVLAAELEPSRSLAKRLPEQNFRERHSSAQIARSLDGAGLRLWCDAPEQARFPPPPRCARSPSPRQARGGSLRPDKLHNQRNVSRPQEMGPFWRGSARERVPPSSSR